MPLFQKTTCFIKPAKVVLVHDGVSCLDPHEALGNGLDAVLVDPCQSDIARVLKEY